MRGLLARGRAAGRRVRARGEAGGIGVLTLGILAVALMLLVVAVDVAAVQLARTQMWDAADGAALDASDALASDVYYSGGLGAQVPVTDESVSRAAQTYVGRLERPRLVTGWDVSASSMGGQGALVRITGHVDLPLVGPVVDAFAGGVTVTVESRARSRTR